MIYLSPDGISRFYSNVTENSILAVQIFDQRKFKRRDQGFLGVVNVRAGDAIDLELGGHGWCLVMLPTGFIDKEFTLRNVDLGPQEEIQR